MLWNAVDARITLKSTDSTFVGRRRRRSHRSRQLPHFNITHELI